MYDALDGEDLLRLTDVDDLCAVDEDAELGDVLDDAHPRAEENRRRREDEEER